ncbi:hypothetical protein EMIT019CA3_300012 [Bacillus pseudomycoides]
MLTMFINTSLNTVLGHVTKLIPKKLFTMRFVYKQLFVISNYNFS